MGWRCSLKQGGGDMVAAQHGGGSCSRLACVVLSTVRWRLNWAGSVIRPLLFVWASWGHFRAFSESSGVVQNEDSCYFDVFNVK
ncbi:hypothetical protein RchiOBHm_Chr2g0168681 [Rosa chinensis]|uniref:Uncharacterized protein n=1 Tax=Rosa chinensis TaxID=74649 RepID=A0A2P6S4M2_ROSCH|nr:hypothetical protein RchiOBHm_Chr2g0168681 [Rosa chinensis]